MSNTMHTQPSSTRLLGLLAGAAAIASACTIPAGPPLSRDITEGFGIQVQNTAYPVIHNKYLWRWAWGGGDQHLFLSPYGTEVWDFTLVGGVINWAPGGVRACINGEYEAADNTTKMFMTGRGDPRAIYQPTWACNPDTDALQIELRLEGRQGDPPGGNICVRSAFGERHEFRWSPPGNTAWTPNRPCMATTLVVRRQGDGGPVIPNPGTSSSTTSTSTSSTSTSSTSTSTSSTSTSSTTSTTSSSSTTSTTLSTSTISTTSTSTTSTGSSSTGTSGPLPYTDMTAQGFRYIGCAPEERTVVPADGPFRTLPVLYASDAMTNELCLSYCQSRGYAYAGTEYRRECWCGSSYAATRQPGTTKASLAGCSMSCMGNTSQKCGGGGWLSLYAACAPGQPCTNAVFT